MHKVTSNQSKTKAFLIGCLFGSALYGLYLLLGKDGDCHVWLAGDDVFATTFGLVFFPVQYVIFSFGDYWTFSDTATTVICLCLVALMYGYIFLSFKLFPKLAVWTFVGGVISFLFAIVAYWNSENPVFDILFWPAAKLHVFVVATHISSGPHLIAVYSCVIGCWYAALACGLRTLIKYPRTTPEAAGTKIVTGWYVGECTNTTFGLSSNLLLIIHGTDKSAIYGELCLSGELGGGGQFHGTDIDSELTFSTCSSADQFLIQWHGRVFGEQIKGTYSVTSSHPEAVRAGQQSQNGNWSCTFVRANTQPDSARVNEVFVYDRNTIEGPFTQTQFAVFVNQNRWPDRAIAATQDRTLWANIFSYKESKMANQTTNN